MNLEQIYNKKNPWPARESQRVLFILDVRSSLEEEVLRGWVQHHANVDNQAFDAPQVCIDLRDERTGFDSGQLVMSLALPDDTLIVPLRIVWTPSEEGAMTLGRLRHLITGDPRRPSPRRGKRILSTAPERVHLMVGKPDTMSNLKHRFEAHHAVDNASSQEAFASFVARQAAVVLDMAERQLKGGRYKMPRHVASTMMASSDYNAAVQRLADEQGKPKEELMKEAAQYMKEMISTPTSFWLDVYARFNTFCLGLGYEQDIVYDQASVEKLREIVRNNPSMLLWTHKTYLDGMVVPKVMWDNDFPMPHMFGGANMNFPGLGYLLHRAGAIFIKRSFQDNELYKITLRHYIGYLMEKRFPMNWAFEGTRSRMGKLMPPRYGLLKYVLEACEATEAQDIHIIPISISYDIIRDVEEYATEQTGRGKGAESLKWFIGYVRSLARPMGKVYMDIGEPVVLPRAPEPGDRLALSKIAFEVAVEANHVTPITFPSLVTMSLLGAAPKALTEEEVIGDLNALLGWAESRNVRISHDFDRSFADQMAGLLGIMIDENIVTRYDEGPEIVYGISLEQHPVASYYRNTVIHFFVNKAIIELALVKASESDAEKALDVFWEQVDHLRDMFKFEFFYAPTDEFHRQIREEMACYGDDWEQSLAQGAAGFGKLLQGMTPLVAHVTLLTYTEAYSVVASLLARKEAHDTWEEKDCVTEALTYGRQAYLQRRISSESSIGKQLFKNGFQMLQSRGLTEGGADSLKEDRVEVARELRELLRRIDVIRAIGVANHGSV
ncbi:glycerol-3-phosphate 1-O-acyltransferase [Pseudohalioglobus lutimaris]|uniref:Glycerol-3-phosphate acyltransferase n=1 Tax=Pseudohalioglobus lutimaris TaxID=1737061 RepID=A0A2N5WX42_9GAMM|nr:glycerol-3-phosphate 1-O-acyltransferase [Pseudohalioglobus lutimaris]PLW66803.1 glycerol-3-phosphate acyltransferase [Pseudohalioglobus lutimaris]